MAGMSALARQSMLADSPWPTYALSPTQWADAKQSGVQVSRLQIPDTCEWQLWHYEPALVADSEVVDPLSLTLSLRDEPDERVQLALDELKGSFPW